MKHPKKKHRVCVREKETHTYAYRKIKTQKKRKAHKSNKEPKTRERFDEEEWDIERITKLKTILSFCHKSNSEGTHKQSKRRIGIKHDKNDVRTNGEKRAEHIMNGKTYRICPLLTVRTTNRRTTTATTQTTV